jgi:hypothetical protein
MNQQQVSVFEYFFPFHPIKIINRINIVDIPIHIYQPYFVNEIVDGYPQNADNSNDNKK